MNYSTLMMKWWLMMAFMTNSKVLVGLVSLSSWLIYVTGESQSGLGLPDKLSFSLLFLMVAVGLTLKFVLPGETGYYINMASLLALSTLFFLASSLILLLFSFEAILIPILLLILGWGYQFERLQAAKFLLFFTMTFSMPFLVSVLWVCSTMSTNFILSPLLSTPSPGLLFILLVGFGVKLPLFLIHLWLPKAHVEAPTGGSMVLASVLLKLGAFGLVRMFNKFLFNAPYLLFLSALGTVGGVGFMAMQSDIKSAIAYSSIGHMNILLVVLLSGLKMGTEATMLVIFSHGMISSLLFFFSGVLFQKGKTRQTSKLSGVLSLATMSWWLLSVGLLANFGLPPFLSSIGEMILFGCAYFYLGILGGLLVAYSLLSCYSSLFLVLSLISSKSSSLQQEGEALEAESSPLVMALLMGFIPFLVVVF